ncbi:MAG: hypothetical protein JWR16_3495 [Nevskia sp.]|nr:hypothetical protein [Nevskia sp.]
MLRALTRSVVLTMKLIVLRLTTTIGLLSVIGSAAADALLPLTNQSALARSFALPELGAATVQAPGTNEFRFGLDWTNEFSEHVTTNPSESLTLDGETQRYAWNWRHGLDHGFDIGLQIPFFVTNGGVLDGIIHNYHELFSLPDGGRGNAPHHRLLYNYTQNGQTLLNVDHSATEFGDVQLQGGWQALPNLALRAMVKLPSGHSDHLTGGNLGSALWADYDPFAGSQHWLGFVSAGGSVNNTGSVIAEQQHRLVGFGGAGVGYRIWQPFAVIAQFYAHSKLYGDSDLKPLRRMGLQGAFGGRYDINQHLAMNAGLQEDLVGESSPDISFHLSFVAH